jgi:hypothetical protein
MRAMKIDPQTLSVDRCSDVRRNRFRHVVRVVFQKAGFENNLKAITSEAA